MNITEKKKQQAVHKFGEAAQYYHQHADIQKQVANGLISSLNPWRDILPPGPILEVGCGTGFLTKQLVEMYPKRSIIVTDASEKMLQFCKSELQKSNCPLNNITFKVVEVNTGMTVESGQYAMVISNFVAQWFDDTAMGLERLGASIKKGGLLLCSFPGNQSFSQWYERCLELGLPFTANPLPDVEEVVIKLSTAPFQIDYYENDLQENFDSALAFFRHLKQMGASENVTGKSLNTKQFRLLLNHWDQQSKGKINIKWHIVYLAAKKDG
ncbi:MAG: methyltransferase domain-containing protein [Balneolaceae bacterium]|nr:methyltransferase domain-containing protein [Balneolaceae bacterium]